jgi:hypothetical protein
MRKAEWGRWKAECGRWKAELGSRDSFRYKPSTFQEEDPASFYRSGEKQTAIQKWYIDIMPEIKDVLKEWNW